MGFYGPDIQAQEVLRDIEAPRKAKAAAAAKLKADLESQGKKTGDVDGSLKKRFKKSKAQKAKDLAALRNKQKARAAKLLAKKRKKKEKSNDAQQK